MTEQQQPMTEADIFAEDAPLAETVISPEEEIKAEIPPELDADEPAEELPEPELPTARPRRGFTIFFGIFTVLLLAAVAVALWYFQNLLVGYESSVNEPPLQAYMELIEKGDYETLYASSGFQPTELNTKEDYIAYLKALYNGAGKLSVVGQVTTDDTVQRYNLYSNGKDKLSTLLVTSETAGDGTTTWYVTTELIYQPTYTVTASEDIDLYINGNNVDLLPSDVVSVTEVQSTVFDFETDVTLPVIRTYTLEGLLLEPDIQANGLSGNECIRIEKDRHLLLMLADDGYERSLHEELAAETVTAHYTTETVSLQELTVSDYSRYSESDFTCTVKFMPVTLAEDGTPTVGETAVVYDMTFLQADGEWTLCALAVDGVAQPIPEPTPEPETQPEA